MTPQDWRTCRDLAKLLAFVQPTAGDRKARLFGVACCRRVWHLFRHEPPRQAVETAERFADGLADAEELRAAQRLAGGPGWTPPWLAVWHVTTPRINLDALARGAAEAPSWFAMSNTPVAREQAAQVILCRDVIGNPFHAVEFSPGWRTPVRPRFLRSATFVWEALNSDQAGKLAGQATKKKIGDRNRLLDRLIT
jgi:hypothetical protein